MENDNYCIIIYDKADCFSTFYNPKDMKAKLSGWKNKNDKKPFTREITYFEADESLGKVVYIVHEFENDVQVNILNDDFSVKDNIFKKLTTEFPEKTLIVAGHWGNKNLDEYKDDIITPANKNEKNVKRNIYLSYYGSELKKCRWSPDKELGEISYIDKILELADINKLNKLEESLVFHKTQVSTLASINKTMPTDSANKDDSIPKKDVLKMTEENEEEYIKNYEKKVNELKDMYNVIAEYYGSKR